jgi:oligopeptide/dipeptide ABC transporter ATP-binding protein
MFQNIVWEDSVLTSPNSNEILQVKDLKTHFYTVRRTADYHAEQVTIKAVDGVNFSIKEGTTLGLTGESGCGKTTLALSILNLTPYMFKTKNVPYANLDGVQFRDVAGSSFKRVTSEAGIVGGEVWYKGKDLLRLSQEEMRHYRGKEIAMVFQNPIPSMHPMEFIGFQVGEALTAHEQTRRNKLRQLVFERLGKVELKDAKKRYSNAPHLFSGGEGQRIMLAMALMSGPELIIADEPTKSLDVIVQRQVLNLFSDMKKQFNLSMLLITHDLAVVAEMSDYVAVMYRGKIIEYSDAVTIYKHTQHPYTRGLLASTLRFYGKKDIEGLRGDMPNPLVEISGCKFHPRCPYAIEKCKIEEPPLVEVSSGHTSACFLANELPEWHY